MTGFIDYIKAYYRVCRLEYAPGEIPAILTVLFLGSATVSRFFALPVLEAMVAFLLLYLSGFIINAIADKEIDKKYDTFKTSIPKSVDLLGENTLKALIVTHVIIAMVLAFHITLQMNSIIPIALVLIGVFFGLGYSVKPFHFKTRGVWHGIALGSSAFFLPFIFLLYVVAGGLTLPLLLFIIGFSFVHYGMEFGNQAIDYIEDKAANVRTPPVRWGMIPSLIIALGCVISGIVTEAASLYYILLSKGSFTFLHPVLTTNVVYVVLLGIILAGYYIPTKGLWQMLLTLRKSKTVEEGMPTLKRICSYAKWQASGIMGVAIVSGILFMGVIYGPTVNLPQNFGDGSGNSVGLLQMASEPEVEFFQDDGNWNANVSVSVLNDNILREKRSIMIEVQSWVANFPLRAEWLILEENLRPNEYWNVSAKIRAHDVDDTTIKINLAYVENNNIQICDTRIVPSQKDLYIYEVDYRIYEEQFDRKADIIVNVFNEENTRSIGDLEVEVWSYTSFWYRWDLQSTKNKGMIHPNENWVSTTTVDVDQPEIDKPIFVIKLFFKIEGAMKQIDDITIYTT